MINRLHVTYVSPYIPRECGIATYTKDLSGAILDLNPNVRDEIVAVDESGGRRIYPKESKYILDYQNGMEYRLAAKYLNDSDTDIVHLQHEFGLFGDDSGANILELVENLYKPLVITFHTMLSNPDKIKREIINRIATKAIAVTVMAKIASERLQEYYGIDRSKIRVIPHGVPNLEFGLTDKYKKKIGLGSKKIIVTFGLISRNKGLQYAIMAMPSIIKEIPEADYLIIGKTHPIVNQTEGDSYLDYLKNLAADLKVSSNVKFVSQFLTLTELLSYLQAADIYLTPYLEPEQITSGTLAYALGAGKPCISTPYAFAREVLTAERGALVPFRDSQSIASRVINYLENDELRQRTSMASYQYSRGMIWENVAKEHLSLFSKVKNARK